MIAVGGSTSELGIRDGFLKLSAASNKSAILFNRNNSITMLQR